jgi:murein L,D-transpeptidase YafK
LLLTALVLGSTAGAVGTVIGDRPIRNREGEISLVAPRVVVLKAKRVLHLFDGTCLVRSYPIDLGVSPDGPKRRRGDGRTPVGKFRIVTKNTDSRYHRFLGIDYPDLATAEWGLANGLISPGEVAAIRHSLAAGRCPNWNTALGGGIGLHGHRDGRDWTGGCVALSDAHVEELFSVLRIGDPVEILP